MFKVLDGHINPQHVSYVENIKNEPPKASEVLVGMDKKSTTGIPEGKFGYFIFIGDKRVTSELFDTYDEAVKNRGILIRIISPITNKRYKDKPNMKRLQEDN